MYSMNDVYTDNGEFISKLAFTRRVNAYTKAGTLFRITEFTTDDGVQYHNINFY